jgi:hypothetical protein
MYADAGMWDEIIHIFVVNVRNIIEIILKACMKVAWKYSYLQRNDSQ